MRRPQLKSFRDRNQVVVGIVGILLIVAAVASVFAVSTAGILEDRYQLTATFESTGGLETSADVRFAGVSVGEVTGIDADFDRGVVVVTFEVEEGIDLGPRTTAEIAAATLLGGYYLRLDGPVTEPHLADLAPDDERRQIPLSRTTAPTSLNDVLADTTETVTAIDFGLATRVVDQVAGAAERNVDTLPALIDDVASISVALAARRDELSTILSSGAVAAGEASEVLARHRDAIDAIIADTGTITGELADTLPVINDTLTKARTLFPLLVGTLDPAGGFSIRGEGIIVHPGQVENILDVVQDLLGILGVQP